MSTRSLFLSVTLALWACTSSTTEPPQPAACAGVAVDDGNACTVDACNPSTGAVTHSPADGLCPGGQVCSATAGCQPSASGCAALQPVVGTALRLQPVVTSGLSQPVHAAAPRGDAARLFVVEQPGRIRVVKNGALLPAPYLDLTGLVLFGGERGLLSVAFHPSFAANGRLYVYFNDATGDIRIVEYTVPDPTADTAGAAVAADVKTVGHRRFTNHNGGQLAFGPDGYLYAGTGDGGGGGDPDGNGQNTASLLGKLLRIDVRSPATPVSGNPFGNEVYHYGLRNPWRFSFDRLSGDLYIGDVGQDLWEEIDFQAAAVPGQAPAPGTNWGWNAMEGTHCYSPATGCDTAGKVLPITEYPHSEGVSVTGGFVYRGPVMPDLAGTYFYGDFGSGFVKALRVLNGQKVSEVDVTATLGGPLGQLSSFGEDGCGELYVVQLSGRVSKIVPGP